MKRRQLYHVLGTERLDDGVLPSLPCHSDCLVNPHICEGYITWLNKLLHLVVERDDLRRMKCVDSFLKVGCISCQGF